LGASPDNLSVMDRITLGRMQNPVRGFLHGSAALAATIGLVLLLRRAWGDPGAVAGAAAYGAALIVMYTVSSLYHSIPWSPHWKVRLQRVDHSMIYLVVAGTFTPIAIASLSGWSLAVALTFVWSIAITGIVLKATLRTVATALSVTLQLSMGWFVIFWLPQIYDTLGSTAVVLIGLGGLCYTAGAVMFLLKRPRLHPRAFSYHELFHVLVVMASVFHFLAVWSYALPAAVSA
jgi:hemolysin III